MPSTRSELRGRQPSPRTPRRSTRRAHVVALPPPQRHRRTHVCELESPRPAEVGELPREPQAAVPERLDAAARVRLVARRVTGRRRRQPPPPLEPARRDPRRDPRYPHRRTHVALKLADEIDRRHRADERDARHALGRDRGERERVRPARRPADDAEPLHVEALAVASAHARSDAKRRAGPATVDGHQPYAERRGDRVVGMAREARVAAAVQVHDRRPVRVADVVDDSASDDQRGPHAELAMVRDGAPERVSPGRELHRQVAAAAGRDDAEPGDVLRADALHAAGRGGPGRSSRARSPPCPRAPAAARARTRTRARPPAPATARSGRCRRMRVDQRERRAARSGPRASLDERRPLELRDLRQDALGVEVEPLLEQPRVDAAEVARRLQVAVLVEPGRETRVLADLRAGDARPDQEARCRPRRGRCRPSRSPRRAARTPSRRASAHGRRRRALRGRAGTSRATPPWS